MQIFRVQHANCLGEYPENLHVIPRKCAFCVFVCVINSVIFCPNSVLLTFHAFGYKNSHNAKTKQL